jgi:hypothetical protein
MPDRFKAFHRPFTLSGALMRVLGPIELDTSTPISTSRSFARSAIALRNPLSSSRSLTVLSPPGAFTHRPGVPSRTPGAAAICGITLIRD